MAKKTKKSQPQLRGRGDYTVEQTALSDPAKRIEAKIDHLERSINKKASVKGAASTVGRTLGNFLNQGDLGALAGETMAKLFGHGDYSINSNSLIPRPGQSMPKFASNKRGTRIIEREYIGDLFSGTLSGSSTLFTNTSFTINPSSPTSFPWLSTIAHLYDQWEPHGIVFEFVSTSSEYNGASQALGAVILSTDYDSSDRPYSNKQEAENADYSCSTKPSLSLMHGIECDPKERPMEVLYTNSTGSDPKFSSLGNFQVCTQGMSVAGVNLGEIWVSYDITFYKKQIAPIISLIPQISFNCVNVTPGAAFLSGFEPVSDSGDIVTSVSGTDSRFTFNNLQGKRFMFLFVHTSWQGENVSPTVSGLTLSPAIGPDGGYFTAPSPGVLGAARVQCYVYHVDSKSAYYVLAGKGAPTGGSLGISIIEVPPTFFLGY